MLTNGVASIILTDMEDQYVHEQHTLHHLLYPIIFCPKRRGKGLVGPVHDWLKPLIEQVAEQNPWHIVRLAIQPDHVHWFMQAHPSTLPSDIPRLIKGRSSHELPEAFPHLMRLLSLGTRSTFSSTAASARNKAQDRTYVCAECGWMGHRDEVGAINISRRAGLPGQRASATGA